MQIGVFERVHEPGSGVRCFGEIVGYGFENVGIGTRTPRQALWRRHVRRLAKVRGLVRLRRSAK